LASAREKAAGSNGPKTVQVRVGPAHRRLDHEVKLARCTAPGTPPHHRSTLLNCARTWRALWLAARHTRRLGALSRVPGGPVPSRVSGVTLPGAGRVTPNRSATCARSNPGPASATARGLVRWPRPRGWPKGAAWRPHHPPIQPSGCRGPRWRSRAPPGCHRRCWLYVVVPARFSNHSCGQLYTYRIEADRFNHRRRAAKRPLAHRVLTGRSRAPPPQSSSMAGST